MNNVAVQNLVHHTDWLNVPLTFSKQDLNLESYPHTYAMVIKANIAAWEISRILVDTGNSADIIFVNGFDQMKLNRNQLHPSDTPLVAFGGKRIEALGKSPYLCPSAIRRTHEQNT